MWEFASCHVVRGGVEGGSFFGDSPSFGNFCAEWCVSQRGALNVGCSTINLGVEYVKIW